MKLTTMKAAVASAIATLRGSGLPRCASGLLAPAQAQQVIGPGQPARRCGNDSLLRHRRRRRLARGGPPQPSSRPACSPTSASPARARRSSSAVEREPADQPGRVRGQHARSSGRLSSPRSRPRRAAPTSQATVDADVQRILEIYRRTGRGLAQRHAAGRRPAERPHRRRLHDQRGRQDRHQGDQLRRQPRLFVESRLRASDDLDRDRTSSASSRTPTSTIPTGSPPTRS